MNYCRTVNILLHSTKIDCNSCELFVKRGLKFSNSDYLPKISHYSQLNKSRFIQSNIQVGKKPNFSATTTSRLFGEGPNQSKERRQTYITFGMITTFVGLIIFLKVAIPTHQDTVFIGAQEKNQ